MGNTERLTQTMDQQRAKEAWAAVKEVDALRGSNLEKARPKYRSLVLKSTVLIRSNGLGQTVSFWASKSAAKEGKQTTDNTAHELLLEHLWEWLEKAGICDAEGENVKKSLKFAEWITRTTSSQYRRATLEALAYLQWLRRFAEAVLPELGEGGE